MTNDAYSWKEMMAIFLARDLEDGERVCCGVIQKSLLRLRSLPKK